MTGTLRIGQGFDVHRFSPDPERPLVLGGVFIPGERGLLGHSDADVVAHALVDAVLGASGLGDIGRHFPEDDPAWEGADSLAILGRAVEMAASGGLHPLSADCTLLAERPRVSPFAPDMAARLGAVLRAHVGVKATTLEGMGALGRVEGIGCLAAVLLAGD
jgi:2-C-methyl-D-erythritol 2,4-cyclodiphosphate synthase